MEMAEIMDDRENAPSPDSKCSICLSKISNKSFTDRCFHMFCFGCLVEWSKRNAVCPLCKQSFSKIFHNIQSLNKYDIYDVLSQPLYLPSLSSVNIVSSINRLAMAGHVSPFSNENEFVITISPDSSFNDSQVMSRSNLFSAPSSHLNNLSQPYIITHSELVQLRIHLLFHQNVDTMRTWLKNELQKISRLVARLNTSYIPRSVERILSEMKRESHNGSTFFSAVSFYIGSEYTKMFLVRLKSYLGSIHDNNNDHLESLESIIESASINTLLNNSPFQESSNSSLGSLVVDSSDVEITNEDIVGGNFVANHRHESTTTSNDHFISGLIKPDVSHDPCSFSLVVSIPRINNADSTSIMDTASSSTTQNNNHPQVDIDVEKFEETPKNISKNPIFLSSDDDDEVIDLVQTEDKSKVALKRGTAKKRIHALTSDDDEDDEDMTLEKNERATTSRCKVKKIRKKRLKKGHSPQPSHSIGERTLYHINPKSKLTSKEEMKERRKFKKHHSGHKNSLRKVQEVLNNAKTEGCDESRMVCMTEDATNDKDMQNGRLIAFEKLFPDKTPSQIVHKHELPQDLPDKIDSDMVGCSSMISDDVSSHPSNHSVDQTLAVNSKDVKGCGEVSTLEGVKGMKCHGKNSEGSGKDEMLRQDGDELKNERIMDDIENTPLDFSLKNFDFKLNLSADTIEEKAKEGREEVKNVVDLNDSRGLIDEDDYCVIEKEVDTISLHSEDSIQVLYHRNKDRDDGDDVMVEGGCDDDIQEIPF